MPDSGKQYMENKGINDQMPLSKPKDFLGKIDLEQITDYRTTLPVNREIVPEDRDKVQEWQAE